jgi:hypothetical protein
VPGKSYPRTDLRTTRISRQAIYPQIVAAHLTPVLHGLLGESIRLARGEIFLQLKTPQRGVKLGEPFTKSRQNPRAKADARQPRCPVRCSYRESIQSAQPTQIHHGCKLTSLVRGGMSIEDVHHEASSSVRSGMFKMVFIIDPAHDLTQTCYTPDV